MKLEFVSLLPTQRELYAIPRGFERFRAYLRTMIDAETGDLRLPLSGMNPMGKSHVPALLDAYLALDAENVATRALREVAAETAATPGEFKVALVMADDAQGGWTNRAAAEFDHCFEEQALWKRGWLVAILWTSEPPSAAVVQTEVRSVVHRAAYAARHGRPRTLRQMLAQEGAVRARAGGTGPELSAEEQAYTREVIAPLLDADDQPTILSVLFGDSAAKALGYAPLGLSDRAGLRLALAEARPAQSAHL